MLDAVRSEVARLLHETRTLIVVDETLSELALEVPVSAPFAVHDRHGTVVSLGSMSKSFWGGLRLGWIRAPRDVAEHLGAARSSFDLETPVLEQLAGARLLQDPDPILERRRGQLRDQRDMLVEHLNLRLSEWTYRLLEGGSRCGSRCRSRSDRRWWRRPAGSVCA